MHQIGDVPQTLGATEYPHSPMRIVHYLERVDFRAGGPPRAVLDLLAVLHGRGHDVTLCTADTRDVPEDWLGQSGPRVVALPRPSRPGGRFARGQLVAAHEALAGAQVLHVHGVWERTNAQIASCARDAGVPWCVTLRGMLDDWCMAQGGLKKRLYLALGGRRVLEDAAFVHCTADGELEQSGKWFPRGRGRVIPNLINLDPYHALPGPGAAIARWPELAHAGPHLLFLSRIQVKKGLEHLLHAAQVLREDFPQLRVWIAGTGDEGYTRTIKALSVSLDLEGCTRFVGHIGGDDKLSLYQAATAFVLPTSQENFGFVQFEALACETPVVTTTLVDTWHQVVDSGGGVAVEQSAEAIVQALGPLLGDQPRLDEMGRAGRAWVFEHLATDRVIEQIEAMYADAAGV